MRAYLSVRVKKDESVPEKFHGKTFVVLKREFLPSGILYHLCDENDQVVLKVPEKAVEII